MKKIAVGLGLLLLAPVALYAQAPAELVFSKCNGFAVAGQKPVKGSAKNCWNPELAKSGRVTSRPSPAPADTRTRYGNVARIAPPGWAAARVYQPEVTARPEIRPLYREIALPISQRADLISGLAVSKHNPTCYTFHFKGYSYQLCFEDFDY